MPDQAEPLRRRVQARNIEPDRPHPVTAVSKWTGSGNGRDWTDCDAWRVTLRRGDRQMTVPFYKGYGHNGAEPTADEVLSALLMDARSVSRDYGQPFEEWARDFGYDPDSRTAERIYRQCERTARRLRAFLGEADYLAALADEEGEEAAARAMTTGGGNPND